MKQLLLPLLGLFASPVALSQTTWFVDSLGGPPPGVGTLSNPYTSISYALAQSGTVSGDTLLVSDGYYFGASVDFLGKDVRVESVNGSSVTHIVSRALSMGLQESAVRFTAGEGPGANLVGFTISGGSGELGAYASSFQQPNGGGILCVGSSPTLRDLVVTGNYGWGYGNGAFFKDAQATLENCTFEGNGHINHVVRGCGIASIDSGLELSGVEIRSNFPNQDSRGGGMYINGGSVVLNDCAIENHLIAQGVGAGIKVSGASLTLIDSRVSFNRGGFDGSGIHASGSSLLVSGSVLESNDNQWGEPYAGEAIYLAGGTLSASSTVFKDNRGQWGGAIFLGGVGTSAVIDSCLFDGNIAHGATQYSCRGGAVCVDSGASATINHSVFVGNQASDEWTAGGSAVFGNALLFGCTLVGNETGGYSSGVAREATLENCILWGNRFLPHGSSGSGLVDEPGSSSVTYCLVEGGWAGLGNIDTDPLFWSQAGKDFNLLPGSPAIDAGNPVGIPDPDQTRADLGALPFDRTHCGLGCSGSLGVSYCHANSNSSGMGARLTLMGNRSLAEHRVFLFAENLPVGQFGYFLMADSQGFVPLFAGSQGNFCLGAPFVRLNDQIQQSNTIGFAARNLNTQDLPSQTVLQSGSTWNFQFWYRDHNPTSTSNTSDAVSVTWQ